MLDMFKVVAFNLYTNQTLKALNILMSAEKLFMRHMLS